MQDKDISWKLILCRVGDKPLKLTWEEAVEYAKSRLCTLPTIFELETLRDNGYDLGENAFWCNNEIDEDFSLVYYGKKRTFFKSLKSAKMGVYVTQITYPEDPNTGNN